MLPGSTQAWLTPRRLCVAVVGCAGDVWWLSLVLLPASRATRSNRFVTLEVALWCPRVMRPVRRPLNRPVKLGRDLLSRACDEELRA